MKITTKTGDRGKTGLFRGARVSKGAAVIDVLGEVDELQAVLGLCVGVCEDDVLREILKKIMNDLYVLMGALGGGEVVFEDGRVEFLDGLIEERQGNVAGIDGFLRPVGDEFSLRVNLARTVCRRAERAYARFVEENFGVEGIYLNRLSDLLFVMGCE